jgi:hypothetical protein
MILHLCIAQEGQKSVSPLCGFARRGVVGVPSILRSEVLQPCEKVGQTFLRSRKKSMPSQKVSRSEDARKESPTPSQHTSRNFIYPLTYSQDGYRRDTRP